MRTVSATRYVTPLREGGSLPAIVEADDSGTYVVKFRGAGQGPKALVAELIAGELARAGGLPVPELVLVEVDPVLGRAEPDSEIQTILKGSGGVNVGLDYLPGALGWDGTLPGPDALLASKIVWLDAFVTNVDRTARNPNLLWWHKTLQLIDHGAALYQQHDWQTFLQKSENPFPQIRSHVLLGRADKLDEADAALAALINEARIGEIVAAVPDSLLTSDGSPEDARKIYRDYFAARLSARKNFVEEVRRARS